MTFRRNRLTAGLAILLSAALPSACNLSCGSEPSVERSTPSKSTERSSGSDSSQSAGTHSTSSSSLPEAAASQPTTVYRLGLTPADIDTSLDSYLASPMGISEQCEVLNELVASVCCRQFEIGCNVRYACDRLPVDPQDQMSQLAYKHQRESSGEPFYALYYESVLNQVTEFMRTLQLYGTVEQKLPVAYTRHALLLDDMLTVAVRNRINRSDPAFRLLGSILPGRSDRGGTRLRLDYYASPSGLLLSVAPVNRSSLAQAIAEYRANLFSVHGRQLTGGGSRHLFKSSKEGVVPRLSGCQALAIESPAHLRRLLRVGR